MNRRSLGRKALRYEERKRHNPLTHCPEARKNTYKLEERYNMTAIEPSYHWHYTPYYRQYIAWKAFRTDMIEIDTALSHSA